MIKVLPKIIILLELFKTGDELTFAQISERTELSKSNLSHLLKSFCEYNLISRTKRGSYYRSERLLALCGNGDKLHLLTVMANRCTEKIISNYNELAVVGCRYGDKRVTIAKQKPIKSLQVDHGSERHYSADWYNTACGRILLAYAPENIIIETVRRDSLPARGIWREARSLPKLKLELDKIREQGFTAFDVDELVRAIGVPAYDAEGKPVFSVSMAYAIFSRKHQDAEIIEYLKHVAEAFTNEMASCKIIATKLAFNHQPRN